MSGYLVVLLCGMEDIPCGLYATRKEANKVRKEIEKFYQLDEFDDVQWGADQPHHPLVEAGHEALGGRSFSHLIGATVVSFKNGTPGR